MRRRAGRDQGGLLVDAVEGPMPQTRFVLTKALQHTTDPKKKEELEDMLKTVQKESKRAAAEKRN